MGYQKAFLPAAGARKPKQIIEKTNSGKYQTIGYLLKNRPWEKITTTMAPEKTEGGMEIRRVFARNLKRLRETQRISQLDLSNKTGLTHNFINDIENCRKWVSPETLAKLAEALEIQPFRLFLSEILSDEYEEDRINIYREDFNDTLDKAVSDWMSVYLPQKPPKQQPEEQ
jgi:transcriptional regulator with XRE-family HTH domain